MKRDLTEKEILNIIKYYGRIGRHKSKVSIHLKLQQMVREGKLIRLESTKDYHYYGIFKSHALQNP